jgi:hypothetical protein
MSHVVKQVSPDLSLPTLTELRALSDRELVDLHDEIASLSRLSPSYILDELARREHYQQARAVRRSARMVAYLAGVVAALAVITLLEVLVVASLVSVLVAATSGSP